MPQTFCRPLIERLDDRRYAAAHAALATALPTAALTIDAGKILHIVGTALNDDISIRGMGDGHTNVVVTTSNGVATNTVTTVLRTKGFTGIAVDGGAGIDTMKVQNTASYPSGTSVEKTTIRQSIAPAGETPSDAAPGKLVGSSARWLKNLKAEIKTAAASKATIGFLGDSLTERFPITGASAWKANFKNALDLGVSGESSRQLLYRIQAGLFDVFKPKKLVLMFGTNNLFAPLTDGTDGQIVAGISEVISALKRRLPHTKLVMVSIPPRKEAGLNARVAAVNTTLAANAEAGDYRFLDVYNQFVGEPVRAALYGPDNHFNLHGYKVLAGNLVPLLESL